MPVFESDSKSIMPLSATRREIDATYTLLRQLDQSWVNLFSKCRIDIYELRQIILVGSGDSWAVALTAAAWIENNSTLNCVARQTFEFLNIDLHRYARETLVVVISASGRPSLVTDALKHAINSQVQVLGLTNNSSSLFSKLTENMLLSGAQKNGMPTQSTSATLYLLLRLVDMINVTSPRLDHFTSICRTNFSQIQREWLQTERNMYREKKITFLGNHVTWGLAIAGTNLLSCGPQIRTDAFLVEEFHHSLRLNQVSEGEHFILLPGSQAEHKFYLQTQSALLQKNASVDIIDIKPECTPVTHLFYVLQYLYEMSWHLAVDFIEQGGRRVYHQENT